MPALIFALILAWFITKALEAGRQQAVTEVRRLREEVTRNVREAGQSPAGRALLRAAAATWRGMQGARRGAGPYAQRIAAGTGPLRRILRAAWAAGLVGARAARDIPSVRPPRTGWRSWRLPRPAGPRSWRLPRMPRLGVCADCGQVVAAASLILVTGDGHRRRVCAQCAAPAAPQPSAPVAPPWNDPRILDAEIVPDPEPPTETADPAQPAAVPTIPAIPVPALTPEPGRDAEPVLDPAEQEAVPAADWPVIEATAPAAVTPAAAAAITTGETMTTPQGALPAGGATGGESREHGQWLAACAGLGQDANALLGTQTAMLDHLHAADGREQVTRITDWAKTVEQFAAAVTAAVASTDPGEQNLITAIGHAGGTTGAHRIPQMSYFGTR
jgi:hypothetical protein